MLARETSKLERLLTVLALAFSFVGVLSLTLQQPETSPLIVFAALSITALVSHVWLNRVAPNRDPLLLPVTMLLVGWGLLVIAHVAPNFLPRQVAWLSVGTLSLCAVAASKDRLRWLRRFKYTWLLFALALLAATLFLGVNPTGAGARLWLSFAGLFLQPSEMLRLLMIAFLAAYLSERLEIRDWRLVTNPQSLISHLQSLAPSALMWLIAAALLFTQQDLGAAVLLLSTFIVMLYLATGRSRLPIFGLAVLMIAGVAGYFASSRVAQRVDIWLNPWADAQGSSFQIVQSLIAVANGGVMGRGLGQGSPGYVPAVHTDFPFAAVGEEFGLIGGIGLLLLFAILSLRGWRIALQAPTSYQRLLAGGLSASIAMQALVIVGGNLKLLPLTGVTLPFVSYGGSSLLASLISVGLLIRLSADIVVQGQISSPPNDNPEVRLATRRTMLICGGIFLVLGLTAGLWSVADASVLISRDDNPRRVADELAIARGVIFARDGTRLAVSRLVDDRVQSAGIERQPRYVREYPLVEAAPVVGYYSQRYGVGGIEAHADMTLRGSHSRLDQLLHRPQVGAAITTTLDVRVQQRLTNAMKGAKGAAVVMDWHTGEVLALVSAPSFDPNTLDEQWDELRTDPNAPLVNRVTQGLYQPGMLLQWFLKMKDERYTTQEDLSSFIVHLSSLDLDKPVPFELQNEFVSYPVTATYSETIGQGTLRLTPLRVAVTAATLAAEKPITPTLLEIRDQRLAIANNAQSLISDLRSPFITFALIGKDQFVGWYVEIDGKRAVVIALEQPNTDERDLRRIADSIGRSRR